MDRAEYIAHGADSVAGWFRPIDRRLFDAIDIKQRELGITGAILEIGCYQGTSAILLGYMKRENDRLVICDVFDGACEADEDYAERARYYTPNFGRTMFEDNYRRFHAELPEIIAAPSSTLQLPEHSFRVIHVDGSHAYDQVRLDLLLAKELLCEGGVCIFDDITSPHTPGVQCAVWQGVIQDNFVPMLQTVKMYGTWGNPIEIPMPEGLSAIPHTVFGHAMANVEG